MQNKTTLGIFLFGIHVGAMVGFYASAIMYLLYGAESFRDLWTGVLIIIPVMYLLFFFFALVVYLVVRLESFLRRKWGMESSTLYFTMAEAFWLSVRPWSWRAYFRAYNVMRGTRVVRLSELPSGRNRVRAQPSYEFIRGAIYESGQIVLDFRGGGYLIGFLDHTLLRLRDDNLLPKAVFLLDGDTHRLRYKLDKLSTLNNLDVLVRENGDTLILPHTWQEPEYDIVESDVKPERNIG